MQTGRARWSIAIPSEAEATIHKRRIDTSLVGHDERSLTDERLSMIALKYLHRAMLPFLTSHQNQLIGKRFEMTEKRIVMANPFPLTKRRLAKYAGRVCLLHRSGFRFLLLPDLVPILFLLIISRTTRGAYTLNHGLEEKGSRSGKHEANSELRLLAQSFFRASH